MSYYILSLGKGSKKPTVSGLSYRSGCYFDWFCINTIGTKNKESVLDCMNDNIYESIKKAKKDCSNAHSRIIQNISLISDASNDILSKLINASPKSHSLLFISFVRTDTFLDKESILNCVVDKSQEKLIDKSIDIYTTFDHYEYIIVCDGVKVSVNQYLTILKEFAKENNILDIVSTYGYNPNAEKWNSEKVFVLAKYGDLPLGTDIVSRKYSALGRYNNIDIFEEISIKDLFQTLSNDGEQKIFIGKQELQSHPQNLYLPKGYDYTKLKEHIETVYNNCRNKYIEILGEDSKAYISLIDGLSEVKCMIVSIWDRGISKYYALCIYESFRALLQFIQDKVLEVSDIEFAEKHGKDYENYIKDEFQTNRTEYLIDLLNEYIRYIHLLSGSMLHSDRKFINADPYQLSCFDVPPRLISFYTALAHYIVDVFKDKKNKSIYTVMFVPDFKQDIYVSSITKIKDYEQEQNLLMLHINEKLIYNIPETIKAVAHEIAHHVGQTKNHRKERSKLYIKSALATIIESIYNPNGKSNETESDEVSKQYMNFWTTIMGESNVAYDNLSNLIDTIYEELNFKNEFKLDETCNDDHPLWYYTSDVFSQIMKILCDVNKKTIKNIFIKFLKHNAYFNNYGYKHYASENMLTSNIVNELNTSLKQCNNKDSIVSFYIKVVSNALAENFSIKFKEYIKKYEIKKKIQNGVVNYYIFDNIIFLYRECMADVQMLDLLRNTEIPLSYADEANIYYDNLSYNNSTNYQREFERRLLTLCAYKVDDPNASTALFNELLSFEHHAVAKCVKRYICNSLLSYLRTFITSGKVNNRIGEITKKIMMATTVHTVSTEIDSLINNYILDLAGDKHIEK